MTLSPVRSMRGVIKFYLSQCHAEPCKDLSAARGRWILPGELGPFYGSYRKPCCDNLHASSALQRRSVRHARSRSSYFSFLMQLHRLRMQRKVEATTPETKERRNADESIGPANHVLHWGFTWDEESSLTCRKAWVQAMACSRSVMSCQEAFGQREGPISKPRYQITSRTRATFHACRLCWASVGMLRLMCRAPNRTICRHQKPSPKRPNLSQRPADQSAKAVSPGHDVCCMATAAICANSQRAQYSLIMIKEHTLNEGIPDTN